MAKRMIRLDKEVKDDTLILQEKSREVKLLLLRIVTFVHRVISRGEIIKESPRVWHTRVRRRYEILPFTILTDDSQTPKGGYTVTILFKGKKVFEVFHQNFDFDPSHSEVRWIEKDDLSWLRQLEPMMNRESGEMICGPGLKRDQAARQAALLKENEIRIREEAARLKVI